ncbi:MAG TPA: phosphonate metabolism protein/1,5-bisphosphokinase (PRPP-forming) PhnN [Desulfarculaceae bacterium]|nr:phosphonate metabolism protein/1,5-bisphosphokinase (PRPP-forming) PhnN [Desulfarculaceae bacterium]
MLKNGRIYYLMGASGAGKDSLIQYLKENLSNRESYHFTRRYVTRLESGKYDISVNQERFTKLLDAGELVLHWQRYGIRYGIGKEIEQSLADGKRVIINGSRDHYLKAKASYPDLTGILIKAENQALKQRLHQRKRESDMDISARMAEADNFQLLENKGGEIIIINNNKALTIAGNQLLEILSD